MKHMTRWMKVSLALAFAVTAVGFIPPSQALELPLTSVSPLSGVTFEDLPMTLPVEQNFQMAMLAVSSELGRSCGKMEAYGWRMTQSEQARVNQIFSSTVEKLRSMSFIVAPETVKAASKDITVFTADRSNKHLMFLWSANDLGLVLNVCETGVPMPPTHSPMAVSSSVRAFQSPATEEPPVEAVVPEKTKSGKKAKITKAPLSTKKVADDGFSPTGDWIGNYTCAQGYTGGTLEIDRIRGKDFTGAFKFYPTEKNPSISEGYYTVYGQYDKETKRILINPGKWLRRPKGFFNTVIVGSFDPVQETFSAYFQGITGCTSFEAVRAGSKKASLNSKKVVPAKPVAEKKKRKKTKAVVKKKPVPSESEKVIVEDKKDSGIILTPTAPAVTPDTAPVSPSPATPTTLVPSTAPVVPAVPTVPAGSTSTAPAAVPPSTVPVATTPPTQPVVLSPGTLPVSTTAPAGTAQPVIPIPLPEPPTSLMPPPLVPR